MLDMNLILAMFCELLEFECGQSDSQRAVNLAMASTCSTVVLRMTSF